MGVHELGDYAVEGFLAVDDVAVGGVGGVEDGGEELVEAGEAAGVHSAGAVGIGVGRLSHVFEEGAHDSVDYVSAALMSNSDDSLL